MQILIVFALLFALMWLFIIRPQRRRQAEQQAMLSQLEPGEEVITAGGLYGFVQEVDDDTIVLEVAPGTHVKIARRAIATVLRDDLDDLEDDEVLDEEDELDGQPLDEAETAGDEGPEPEPAEATRR